MTVPCTCGTPDYSLPMDQHRPGVGVKHARADADERDRWHPLTWRERFRLLPGVHDAWFVLSYYTGVRNRLRCPSCKSVGTWKMHGSLVERWFYGDIKVRRWLCKWCGYYAGPRGRIQCYPGPTAWALPEPGHEDERRSTPMELVKEHLGKVWPWYG